ncbi:MAG: MBOAT family O-acyltransferase [Planctomycetota bacterium]
MDLISFEAVGFLAAVFAVLRLPVSFAIRRWALFVFNLGFLATFDPLAPAIFLATSSFAYALARWSVTGPPSWKLWAAGAPLLLPLFLPKLGLFASQAGDTASNVLGSRVVLFVGASYFTLRAIHFVVDSRRKGRVALSFVDHLTWNSFFPTVVAGPIERSEHFAATYPKLGRADLDDLVAAVVRIFQGLLKRVVLAPLCLAWARDVSTFGLGDHLAAGDAWISLYAICLYAYLDFAGYSDLAIGAARLFGIKLAENFDNPYLRTSISEFWKGWHISLSFWIRDYLFIPMCGRSSSKLRPHVAAVASMVLCGLWHGPTPAWALWGFLHGAGLSVHQVWTIWLRKRFKLRKRLAASRAVRVVAVLLTFHFVALTWVPISVPGGDLSVAVAYWSALFGAGGGAP